MKLLVVVALLAASTAAFADDGAPLEVTLPDGAIGVAAGVNVEGRTLAAVPPVTPTKHERRETLGFAFAYGITSELTAGLTYAIDAHDADGSFPSGDRWRGPLYAHAELAVFRDSRTFVAVGGDLVVHFEDRNDRTLHLGVAASYGLSASIAVFTGTPLPNAPAGEQLTFRLSANAPISLALPVGVLYRPALPVFAFVDTTLATLSLHDANNQLLFSDVIPVDAGAFYRATSDLDVGLVFSDDLEHPRDIYTFGVTARYTAR